MNIEPNLNLDELCEILKECSLPVSDLKTNENCVFFSGRDARSIDSCVGVELFKNIALLRSLAVLPRNQGKGKGRALVHYAENYCQLKGVQSVYLLTTTASSYFTSLGYGTVSRDLVPNEIKESTQYSSVCPSSAIIMFKNLVHG